MLRLDTFFFPGVTRQELKEGNENNIQLKFWDSDAKKYKYNNALPLQDYIKGVVAKEIGFNWVKVNPLTPSHRKELAKAQAIASKGFGLQILKNRGKGGFLKSTTDDQAYISIDDPSVPSSVVLPIKKAVNDTKDEYLTVKK